MADPILVLDNNRNSSDRSDIITNNTRFADIPGQPSTSFDGSRSGSMENHRQYTEEPELSDRAKDLVRNASYEPDRKRWASWYDKESLYPFQAPVERITNFLTEIFLSVPLEYSTLNVYRSSLSAYHPPIQGFKVGQHPLIKDLLRGGLNTRPPKPK